MPLTVSCETFARLARLSQIAENKEYSWLRSVALQRKNGRLFALATDACFCAVELVAEQPGEPDDFALITIDPVLLAQCETEKAFGGQLFITKNQELNFTEVRSSFGFIFPGNAGIFPISPVPLRDWQDWVKPFPKSVNGSIFLDVDRMSALVAASPSGRVLLPKSYDTSKPLPIRDAVSSNWLGFFVPYDRAKNAQLTFDEFPAWAVSA